MAASKHVPPSTESAATEVNSKLRYIDIGINLADPIFRGRYNGTQRHPDDLQSVVARAVEVGCLKLILTGSSFKTSRDALKIAREFPGGTLYTTAGIHPCSSAIFSTSYTKAHDDDQSEDEHTHSCESSHSLGNAALTVDEAVSHQIISDLHALIRSAPPGIIVSFGEFGLDYDRLHFCPAPIQRHSFAAQLRLAASLSPQLPLFLHSRAAHADFVAALRAQFGRRLEGLHAGGVVHSFTGTAEELHELTDELGLYVGVNGCSFKTEENCAVVREMPLERLMLETDGPWCEVRPSHAGWAYLVEMENREREMGERTLGQARENAEAVVKDKAGRLQSDVKSVVTNGDAAGASEGTNGANDVEHPSNSGRSKLCKSKEAVQPQKSKKKAQKKKAEVPDRFKVVKKEKWEEGAMVKGRNEPCTIERIARIVAAIKGIPLEDVTAAAWANAVRVFGLEEKAWKTMSSRQDGLHTE